MDGDRIVVFMEQVSSRMLESAGQLQAAFDRAIAEMYASGANFMADWQPN